MSSEPGEPPRPRRSWPAALEVLDAATRLGLTSFGGPVAHLGYFREEYVVRRRWLDERTYADLVALCQFLPGPASSQVGIAVGIMRARLLGGLAAWLGFTLPSAVALVAFAFAVRALGGAGDLAWLHGLQLVAVAVIAQAVWNMARDLTPDRSRLTLALVATVLVLAVPTALAQVLVIAAGGAAGALLLRSAGPVPEIRVPVPLGRRLGAASLLALAALLAALPLLRRLHPNQALAVADSFFRVGALVFGGGHVVLPLLQAQVVAPGWVTGQQFLAGYGAAQAVPGPLFTVAAYLGAVMRTPPNGVAGAALALVAIFAPSFLLVAGALPFWEALRRQAGFQAALRGINAAVVGLLLAALYDPVWTGSVHTVADFALVLAGFGLLAVWRLPPWSVVLAIGTAGAVLHAFVSEAAGAGSAGRPC